METEETGQAAAPVVDSSGDSTESVGVSSAEPTAPAAETTEPSVEASAESVESAPEPVAPFPEVDAFDWDSWDGSDYEAFPEQIRPWADRFKGHHTKNLDSVTKTYDSELSYWKKMYEAMNYGEEDPRVAELTTSLEEASAREKQAQEQLEALTKEINAEREAENNRYFGWFEKNYQGKLEELAKTHGAEAAEQMVIDLMDLDMDVHIAVEVSLMGTDAVTAAKALSESVKDPNLIMEILTSRFQTPKAKAPEPAPAPEPPSPAAQVVAGSAPVSRPAQLVQEKGPEYGAGRSQRMGALMSAAENAIRKSKRR